MSDKLKKELAEKFSLDPPCTFWQFSNQVEAICTEKECTDLCTPADCWLKIFDKMEEEK